MNAQNVPAASGSFLVAFSVSLRSDQGMSLFGKLIRLGPSDAEDYLTEIVAHVLSSSPELVLEWLRSIDCTKVAAGAECVVSTQEELPPLDSHEGIGSRPDMTFRITSGARRELIYMESKVGSKEGVAGGATGLNQLQRYADHLLAQKGFDSRTLVYITRDFEPKERPKGEGFTFVQLRWSDFYAFFSKAPSPDPLLADLLNYLEENNMSQSNQFTVLDLLAITNFNKARKVMDATMWGSVYAKFKKIFGNKWSVPTDASSQLHQWSRYVMYSKQGQGDFLHVTLGYWIHDESVTKSPTVGVQILANPKHPQKQATMEAMRTWLNTRPEWKGCGLGDERAWSLIMSERELQSFVANTDSDHVSEISGYLESLLDDVKDFAASSKHLPWNSDVSTV